MCVVALALDAHPRWRLVVAGNRDEFHARAAAPLARWDDAPQVIAGRDLVSGGGWIGVSQAGRLAVLTNVAGYPRGGDAPSRGALVADYLRDGTLPADGTLGAFGGFTLIAIGEGIAELCTNRPATDRRALAAGLHGIANGPLDPPSPRTRTLTASLGDWMAAARPVEDLLERLGDDVPVVAGERAVFIRDAVYGTRCSTVIAVDAAGAGVIVERRFGPMGAPDGETRIGFTWPNPPAAR